VFAVLDAMKLLTTVKLNFPRATVTLSIAILKLSTAKLKLPRVNAKLSIVDM
jgi:hypothetical protein